MKNDEMSRTRLIALNSGINVFGKLIITLFGFLVRTVFIKKIGVELLGLSSTFFSIYQTISISELGFQTAIVYNLYAPLKEHDENVINKLINIIRVVYKYVGLFFIVASVFVLPFLNRIITGIEFTSKIYLYFMIQAISSISTYFLGYYRTLLYSDQRSYVTQIIDTLSTVVLYLIQIACLFVFANYTVYISLSVLQAVVSNLIIRKYCKANYPFLRRENADRTLLQLLLVQVKDIFIGTLASYVYGCTDNLVISAFVSTVSVGLLSNYVMIKNVVGSFSTYALNPIAPIVGNYIANTEDKGKTEFAFEIYSHARFIISLMFIPATFLLMDEFIIMWIGEVFLLPKVVTALMLGDFYIHINHGGLVDYINGAGLFKQGKYINMMGAVTNIVTSIIFARIIGIAGVLAGTVISQGLFWIGRSILVYDKCFEDIKHGFGKYWISNLLNMFFFFAAIYLANTAISFINISSRMAQFIIHGLCIEAIVSVVYLIIYTHTRESEFLREKMFARLKARYEKRKNT